MGRKIYTISQREKLIDRARNEFQYKTRVRHLYNYTYKRSAFYRISFVLRILVFILSAYILYFNSLFTSTEKEILTGSKIEEFYIWRKTDDNNNKDFILSTTSNNKYAISFLGARPDVFLKNDTVKVIKNIFGKKTFIAKNGSTYGNLISRFRRFNSFLLFVGFATLLSLLTFDAFDYLYRVNLRIILFIDIFSIIFYLLL